MPRWTFSGGTFPPYCRHFRRSGAAEAVGAGRLSRRRRARFHKIPVRGASCLPSPGPNGAKTSTSNSHAKALRNRSALLLQKNTTGTAGGGQQMPAPEAGAMPKGTGDPQRIPIILQARLRGGMGRQRRGPGRVSSVCPDPGFPICRRMLAKGRKNRYHNKTGSPPAVHLARISLRGLGGKRADSSRPLRRCWMKLERRTA